MVTLLLLLLLLLQVCGKEDARVCSRCKEVAYCGKDCQTQVSIVSRPQCSEARSH
jgi:hypothetical protein